jgi:hypothetical protein
MVANFANKGIKHFAPIEGRKATMSGGNVTKCPNPFGDFLHSKVKGAGIIIGKKLDQV